MAMRTGPANPAAIRNAALATGLRNINAKATPKGGTKPAGKGAPKGSPKKYAKGG